MTNKIILAVLVLTCLIGSLSVAQAGMETKIVPEQRLVISTAIYGNLVTWYENSGNTPHIYDLSIGKEDTPFGGGVFSSMEVYESKIVWDDGFGVALYDTSTKELTQIAGGYLPDIYGDKIVYEINEPDTGCTLYLYDLKTKNETKIIDGNNADYKLAIYGNKIIWISPNNPSTIYIYDIPSEEKSTINSSDVVNGLDIYGNVIVWQSGNDIYMCDISTYNITKVTLSGSASRPRIYGNRIAYVSAGDIYMYEISTAKTTRITYSACAYAPSIYNDKIVYADYRNDPDLGEVTDIYLYNLSAETIKPEAIFTANATSGKAPLDVLFTATGTEGTPTSWNWTFGDGTFSRHMKTATHTFTNPGTYTVNLTVSNDAGSDTVTKEGYITVTRKEESIAKPVADFYSPEVEEAVSWTREYIYKNDVISFFDISTGNPTSWFWDFGDGNTSTEQNPTHVYGKQGGFIVNLTVSNDAGSDIISKYGYVLIETSHYNPPHFSADVTFGNAPLIVTFHDTDEDGPSGIGPIWRDWDFGDGTVVTYVVDDNESATPYATHVYEKPGKYSVTLCTDDRGGVSLITKYNYITVTDPDAPIANFSSNVSEGYSPLTVQFNDSSQNTITREWDFNYDGQVDSEEINPVYTYTVPGTYTVNMKVSNGIATASKTGLITVLIENNSSIDNNSSGGNSHSSSSGSSSISGGSGGGAGSPEPAKNVKVKELCQVFITSGKNVKFDFTKNATAIVDICFDSKKTVGKTTTIIEMLKNKSTLTPDAPEGEVYNYLNIWVGNGGYGSDENNLENAVINFRVEKSWMQDKGIDQSSIVLNRYSDKKWNELPTTLSGEDSKYLYFKAETPGFSPFAITGEGTADLVTGIQPEKGVNKNNGCTAESVEKTENEGNTSTSEKKKMNTPGFEIIYGIAGLLEISLYRRR